MKSIRAILILTLVALLPGVVRAQNISQIAESDPLIITGAVGTHNTYRYSTGGSTYGSPLSNMVYANLNISIYGFSMPFSLYYSNDNLRFNYPQITFNLTPSYGKWKGHIGQSSMAMSSYVMNMSFNGVGLEYNDNKFRAGVFYGRLRKAVNDDPTDPFARSPQFKRMGWGFKVGYGTSRNYLDLYLLRAYDQINSIDDSWLKTITPKDNIVVGLKGCIAPLSWLNFSANAATSVFSTDTEAEKVSTKTSFDKIFDVRYSSLMRFAGDASMNLILPGFNTSISYRMVQPDYISLGTNYISNNYHSLGINVSTQLFRKINLTGSFNGQEDNLTKKQLFTTRGYVYSAAVSTQLGSHISLMAGYNGYLQDQADGTKHVTDSSRVHRRMESYTFSPTYSFNTTSLSHSLSASVNFTQNRDLNKFASGESDVKTLALGASYGLSVEPWGMNFDLSYSHQMSKGYDTRYSSDVTTLGANRAFLKDKNLNLSGSVSLAYNEVRAQSKSLSLGFNCGASYNLAKVHMLSASAGFNKYGDANMSKIHGSMDQTDISVTFNYTYTFSLIEILSNKHKMERAKEAQY